MLNEEIDWKIGILGLIEWWIICVLRIGGSWEVLD